MFKVCDVTFEPLFCQVMILTALNSVNSLYSPFWIGRLLEMDHPKDARSRHTDLGISLVN
jgi:hypothetical protein